MSRQSEDVRMDPVVTETTQGKVAGTREGDLVVFRGIPYAAAPVGGLRWRAPQPALSWSGVREAVALGPMCIQPPPDATGSVPGDPTEASEDCLYLNVYTPSVGGERLPVMVFIHGGGFVSGSSGSALYTGEHLAHEGVVVVTLNYRLGSFGWLSHPALADPEDPAAGWGNWGLADQLAGLEWISHNIAAFGGDPGLVTVFGESAGAMSIAALLATTAPGRLFHRAILQSGAALALGPPAAERVAEDLAGELGIGEVTRQALLAVPAEELLRAQMAIAPRYQVLGLPLQPVIDGGLLSEHPASAIAKGSAASVDVLVGTNRDEWRFWTWSNPSLREIDEERLRKLVLRQVEGAGLRGDVDPDEAISTYRQGLEERGAASTPTDVYSALASDWTFRVPAMRLAGACGSRASTYLFDWESPFGNGVLGSCHALDLPFVFGSYSNRFVAVFAGQGPEADRLSTAMRRAWARFAATGDPSCAETGPWASYAKDRTTMRLGKVIEPLEAPMEKERAFLDAAFGQYGKWESELAMAQRVPERE